MKTLISTLILGAGLVLGGCGDKNNQKYQDFANFIIKEGKKDATGSLILNFSKDDKNYICMYKKNIYISVAGAKVYEVYHNNLELDSYDYLFEGKHNHREIFEMLIDSIPKWYAESKKEKE